MSLRDNFRIAVRKRRKELDLTQAELGEKLGIARENVAQVELGTYNPSLEVVERFGKALNCPPLFLLMAPEDAEVTA